MMSGLEKVTEAAGLAVQGNNYANSTIFGNSYIIYSLGGVNYYPAF